MQHEWMSDAYRDAGRYLVRLISGGLNARDAGRKPENVSWKQLYSIARRNGVEGIGYFGLRHLSEPPAEEICRQWENGWNMTCYRQLNFDEEREQILKAMSLKGIAFLPLKGILLSGYYPEPGMRSMVDNDILYGFVEASDTGEIRIAGADEAEREKSVEKAQSILVKIMQSRGYRVENLKGNHDIYLKEPIFNFEMHRRLISEGSPFYSYYSNPWKKAVLDEENGFRYSFPDEDEYIYLLVHAFKHFDQSGCGIRFLLDLCVFLKKKGGDMDWDYVSGELQKLDLSAFESQMRKIAQSAFDGAASLSEEQEEMIFFLLGCGTHGNIETRVSLKLQKIMREEGKTEHVKLRYVRERLMLSDAECKDSFPFFYRHRSLKPLLAVYRCVTALIRRPQNVRAEVRQLRRAGGCDRT